MTLVELTIVATQSVIGKIAGVLFLLPHRMIPISLFIKECNVYPSAELEYTKVKKTYQHSVKNLIGLNRCCFFLAF